MNNLYNAQDFILLCEIIENRCHLMLDKYDFNPRTCNSASTSSDFIKRDLSKVTIPLPTSNEVVQVFEKRLTVGFSCINTRLSFDTEMLLPNANKVEIDDDNEHNWKDYCYKICYKLKLDKILISKILKLDENNQCSFATTKPLPTGFIKKPQMLTRRKFNLLVEIVDLDDPISHLFVVDIHFDQKRASVK